jgi:hypothetical protein
VRQFAPHFCGGRLTVAFVFSAPGTAELRAAKPVAGKTGENLELALKHLHRAHTTLFPSSHRYDYRITNASSEPISVSLGDASSEARGSDIRDARNVERVLRELEGCHLAVLGGNRAGSLTRAITDSGMRAVRVPHVGNKGLNSSFRVPDSLETASPADRRRYRVQLWARAVLEGVKV